ncbi:oocyte zinc finger protein XlCOF6 isoform X2 [Folsomia candida]|uniref:oocyte zinc finger protein XlCOF6 isoform X2 n=1 Tax=Folsomia candida TaxID=158441 RepID=UPI000B909236|nr:oocyte zinc finger protein XlCOF6 isoform X2 [Folsomia candida]
MEQMSKDACCLLCFKSLEDVEARSRRSFPPSEVLPFKAMKIELFCDLLTQRRSAMFEFPYKSFEIEDNCELCQDCAPLVGKLEEIRNLMFKLGEKAVAKMNEIQSTMLQSSYDPPRNDRGNAILKIHEEILTVIEINQREVDHLTKPFLSDVFEAEIKRELENGYNRYSLGPDELFVSYITRRAPPKREIEIEEEPDFNYLPEIVEDDDFNFAIFPSSQKRLPRRPESSETSRTKRKREPTPETEKHENPNTNVLLVKRPKTTTSVAPKKAVKPKKQKSPPSDSEEDTKSDNEWTPKTENDTDSTPSDEEGVDEDETGTAAARTHKCMFCTKAFTTQSFLCRHINRDHNIACPVTSCDSKFATMEARNSHLNVIHPDVSVEEELDPYQCPICSTKCRKSTFAVHMVIRHENGEKKFPCDKCPKSFCLIQNYERHVELHKFDGIKPFVCDVCDSRFADEARLQRHVATHKSKPAKCEQCGKSYSSKKALRKHMAIHRGAQKYARCPHCDATFSHTKSLKRHIARDHAATSSTGDDQSHLCQLCGKSFYLAIDLKTHLDRHQGKFQVACDTCGETLSDLTTLKSHRIKVHGEDPFVCEECGRTFTVLTALKRHKITHMGIKEFKCPICHSEFLRKHDLLAHMRSHSDERPYPCPQCEQAFKVKHSLKIHIKRVHTPGYVAPTPHHCPHCGKPFHRRYLMEGHIRQVHTGVRPFTCDLCGKAFSVKEKLSLHLRNTHGMAKSQKRRV